MRFADPHAHVLRDLDDCFTLDPVEDYVPVESEVADCWFAIHMPTGVAHRVDELPPDIAAKVRIAIIGEAEYERTEELVLEGLADPHLMKAIFLAGSGGSGKTAIADAMFGGAGLKVISTDRQLVRYMRAANEPLERVGQRYDLFRAARDAAQMELRHYAQRRLGIVIDGTGWRYDKVAEPAKKLRELGYDIFMVFVTTTLERALERNRLRREQGGRYVPDSFIEDAWRGAHRNLDRYVKLFGPKNMHIIDNDVDVEVDDWVAVIKPKLHNIGQKILRRPLQNEEGKEWLWKQLDPETRTLDKPGPSEWPKPEPPPPLPLPPVSEPAGQKHLKKPSLMKSAKKRAKQILKGLLRRGGGAKGKDESSPPVTGPSPERMYAALGCVRLPTRAGDLDSAVAFARARVHEYGTLYLAPLSEGFEVVAKKPFGDYIEVTPDRAQVYRREDTGAQVATSTLHWPDALRALVQGIPDTVVPIPLEEKHWKDRRDDFRNRYQIAPEKKRDDVSVCSIGKSAKNGKWYGWSHRAFSGFGVGDRAFPKLHGMNVDWDWDKRERWEKAQIAAAPKIQTDAEAKQSAVNFADWVA